MGQKSDSIQLQEEQGTRIFRHPEYIIAALWFTAMVIVAAPLFGTA
jgi:hypothetical protein